MRIRGRDPSPGRAGFTLIEVIGALLIFSAGVLMVVRFSGAAGERLERSAVASELVVVARHGLDSLRTVPFDSLAAGSGHDLLSIRGRSYRRTWSVESFNPLLKELSVSLEPDAGAGPRYDLGGWVTGGW